MTDMHAQLERLYARRTHGIKPGLDMTRALLDFFEQPQRRYAVVHVGGTNGKGSVCALLASMLRAAGLRVGLYTSPHLVSFHERVQVDGVPISDDALLSLLDRVEQAAARAARRLEREATFFECATALALEHFARSAVEVAVVEVGLGGRLDATNVVEPTVSVVTGVDLEHTELLGSDLASIAAEKAGIVKPGRPVVCAELKPEPLAVFQAIARERSSPLIRPAETVSVRRVSLDPMAGQTLAVETDTQSYGRIALPLAGACQAQNFATALAALETFWSMLGGGALAVDAVRRGAAAVSCPARFQILQAQPPVVLDGAHNPGAARVLAATLRECFGKQPLALVTGLCADKDMAGFLQAFQGRTRTLWAVPLDTARSCPPAKVVAAAHALGWEAESSSLSLALQRALAWARREDGVLCIAGSLYLAGTVLKNVQTLLGGTHGTSGSSD